jgi:hypothetical protein
MNDLREEIGFRLNGVTSADTIFKCDPNFSMEEINVYNENDRNKIWAPDGVPFLGEFDLYIKVFKNNLFQGFFRLEIFPWNEINLHIAFPTSNSFKSMYYIKTTSLFLHSLQDLKYKIYCFVDFNDKNVLKYMYFFDFKFLGNEQDQAKFKFENLRNLNLYI